MMEFRNCCLERMIRRWEGISIAISMICTPYITEKYYMYSAVEPVMLISSQRMEKSEECGSALGTKEVLVSTNLMVKNWYL